MLRPTLIGVSMVAVVVTAILVVSRVGGLLPVFGWIGVQAAIVLIAIVFERGRYRPPTTAVTGWVHTPERFMDPTSGEWLAVEFNPGTGERRYVPEGPSSDSSA